MPPVPWTVMVQNHPGSSADDIAKEPDWGAGLRHRIGFKNDQDRVPGITHLEDEYDEDVEEAREELVELNTRSEGPQLINFRDAMGNQKVSACVSTVDAPAIVVNYILEPCLLVVFRGCFVSTYSQVGGGMQGG